MVQIYEPNRNARDGVSTRTAEWRPTEYKRQTPGGDMLRVFLSFDWRYQILVFVPWCQWPQLVTAPTFGWKSPEEAMERAEKAILDAKKTKSEAAFKKRFKDQKP